MTMSSPTILRTGIPSRSALMVAKHRAVHQLLDDPCVLNDPFAIPILGMPLASIVREDPFQFNDPLSRGLRGAMVVRSKYAEEGLEEAVKQGVRQYVVLGAGLDTFFLRNRYAEEGLHVYEVDHPATQAWKKALLQEAGLCVPETMTFVPVDFETQSLSEGLREAGFRADLPVYISWLGVTVYLTKEAIFDVLRFVSSLPSRSSIAFDYCLDRALLHPIDRAVSDFLGKMISEQGEPWISFFEPESLKREVEKLGFSAVDDVGPEELNLRYFYRRKDGLRTGGTARLMRAKKV